MLEFMHELLKPLLDSFSSLKMQLQAALSIPVTDTAKLDEPEGVARDSMDEQGAPAERVNDFAAPGVMNLLRRVLSISGRRSPMVVG